MGVSSNGVGCGPGYQPLERVARQPLPGAVFRELPITQSVWVGLRAGQDATHKDLSWFKRWHRSLRARAAKLINIVRATWKVGCMLHRCNFYACNNSLR